MRITPKNWSTFQHYKDRSPVWIKLHRSLLNDYTFHSLPIASKALAPMLWLLASEYEEGIIDAPTIEIAFRLRMDERDFIEAFNPLVEKCFFYIDENDRALLAIGYQNACPEKKTQVQTYSKDTSEENSIRPSRDLISSPSQDDIFTAKEMYNKAKEGLPWAEWRDLSPTRIKALKARLKACGGLVGWQAALDRARASPFLRGETPRSKGHEGWKVGIDFFLQQRTFTKLMEGFYDGGVNNSSPTGFNAVLAGASMALGPTEESPSMDERDH